jgi:hypothetical protein
MFEKCIPIKLEDSELSWARRKMATSKGKFLSIASVMEWCVKLAARNDLQDVDWLTKRRELRQKLVNCENDLLDIASSNVKLHQNVLSLKAEITQLHSQIIELQDYKERNPEVKLYGNKPRDGFNPKEEADRIRAEKWFKSARNLVTIKSRRRGIGCINIIEANENDRPAEV